MSTSHAYEDLNTPAKCGFTLQEAMQEAHRCLQCKNPLCKKGCPISHDVPQWIHALSKGNMGEAFSIIQERSYLPFICGTVCPHEKQCEGNCILNKKNTPIKVGALERFIAEFAEEAGLDALTAPEKDKGRIAVVGSGPAGITAAIELSLRGYAVSMYEMEEELGGILTYGIPTFRLEDKSIVHQVERLKSLGVDIHTGVCIGKDKSTEDLLAEGFDAVFLGIGATQSKGMSFPGDTLKGVVLAADFLRQANLFALGKVAEEAVPVKRGQHVIVIGGGNVAMDSARTALRMGAKVTVMYRRTDVEMPANRAEYLDAVEEGVVFRWRTQVREGFGEDGQLVRCHAVFEGGEEDVDVDVIILAIGSEADPAIVGAAKGVTTNEKGYILTQELPYGMTARQGVFSAGDVVHSPETVVLAMREAKRVAEGIDEYVSAMRLMKAMQSAPAANEE